MRRIIIVLVAIIAMFVGSLVAPVSASAAGGYYAKFVRSSTNCNVGTLTLVGVKPARYGVVGLAWKRTSNYAATIQHKGRGGYGVNWRQRFNVADYGEKFPKGEFKLQVNYLWVRYGVAQSIFTNTLTVPA